EGDAAGTLRERARLCPGAALLVDVHVKHASPLGRETVAQAAADAIVRGLADAVIVTGQGTGYEPDAEHLASVRAAIGDARLLIGSGVTESNARELLAHANGAIVGTFFKRQGKISEPVDPERVARLRAVFDSRA
ncbi:MAG: BtpA/SgcQ family protein, partial [Planctomycetota bacterium]